MQELYYIGLDVHKKSISYAIKIQAGAVVAEGKVAARRAAMEGWLARYMRIRGFRIQLTAGGGGWRGLADGCGWEGVA